MTEAFVQYVWQFQYFDKKELRTTTGDIVEVFSPGTPNHDGGPDFLNARIKIGDIEWIGNVEAHDNASGWRDHHHDEDRKSTRLNSSHVKISYAVFCLKKKIKKPI